MKAVKRFDLNHTVRLATFAVYWIKSEIHEYIIRNWRMVKIATTKAQRKLFFRLRKQLNYESRVQKNLQDIATSAGVTLQDAQHMHTRMMCYEESLESKAAYHDHDTLLGDVLSLPGDNPMETVTAMQGHALQRVHLEHAIAALNDRERWIVEQRWLLDDAQEKPTLEMLSQHLGVSIERARQLEVQALKRMRTFLHNKNIAFVDL